MRELKGGMWRRRGRTEAERAEERLESARELLSESEAWEGRTRCLTVSTRSGMVAVLEESGEQGEVRGLGMGWG